MFSCLSVFWPPISNHCIIKTFVQFPPNWHCSLSQMLWAGITLSPCIIHFSSPHYRTCTYVTYTSLTLYMVYEIWRKACAVTFVYKSYWDWWGTDHIMSNWIYYWIDSSMLTNNYIHSFTVEFLEVLSLIKITIVYICTAESEIKVQLIQINAQCSNRSTKRIINVLYM